MMKVLFGVMAGTIVSMFLFGGPVKAPHKLVCNFSGMVAVQDTDGASWCVDRDQMFRADTVTRGLYEEVTR